MTTEISHEIEIDASPAAVWSVLADTEAYGEWNPFVRRLDGELREGARLDARIEPPGGRGMTFASSAGSDACSSPVSSTASTASRSSRSRAAGHASSSRSASAASSSGR